MKLVSKNIFSRENISVEELRKWDETSLNIIKWFGKYYIVKPLDSNNIKREKLAYNLIKKYCNVPYERVTSSSELARLKKIGAINDNINHCVLIVVAQTMKVNQMPNQDLNSATASELVFSTFIRRRDVDIWNRTYVDGVPVFYDLSACLDFEKKLANIEDFFSYNRYGFAGSWRVKEKSTYDSLDSTVLRANDDHYNYIDDKSGFISKVKEMVKFIKDIKIGDDFFWGTGYSELEAKEIQEMLINNQKSIEKDIDMLISRIIFSNTPPDSDKGKNIIWS